MDAKQVKVLPCIGQRKEPSTDPPFTKTAGFLVNGHTLTLELGAMHHTGCPSGKYAGSLKFILVKKSSNVGMRFDDKVYWCASFQHSCGFQYDSRERVSERARIRLRVDRHHRPCGKEQVLYLRILDIGRIIVCSNATGEGHIAEKVVEIEVGMNSDRANNGLAAYNVGRV